MTLRIAILAAGRASRFGGGKLDADVAGKPLGRYALHTVLQLDCGGPLLVVADPIPEFARDASEQGLAELIVNPRTEQGLATSVALAASSAAAEGASALLLVLADMPLVSLDTLRRLATEVSPGRAAAVRHPDGHPGIPACFPHDAFPALQQLHGDRGARALLRDGEATLVDIPAAELRDIDTPEDLAFLRALVRL